MPTTGPRAATGWCLPRRGSRRASSSRRHPRSGRSISRPCSVATRRRTFAWHHRRTDLRWRYRLLTGVLAAGLIAGAALAVATRHDLMPLPATLNAPAALDVAADSQVLARDGTPLNRSFGDAFNRTAIRTLSDMPLLLRQAFLAAEDRRFWEHGGADWLARFAALWGNLRAGRVQRGASTIGEQAARILQARPRTYWSHWIAGRDAQRLLDRFGHARV